MSKSNNDQLLWAVDDIKTYPLPEHRVLVRNPRNGKHAVLTLDVHAALGLCREFQTLEEHAKTIATTLPGLAGQEEDIVQVLRSLQADGLMLSSKIYGMELQPLAQPVMNTDKPVAAVITWERPEALARCLQSLRDNCELDNLAAFYVIDDTRTPATQNLNRQATELMAETVSIPVHYMGADEQRAFMQQLIRQVPALEPSIRFLIDRDRWADHWTSGLARTVALLLSAGKRLLVLDDDIICEVFNPPEPAKGASFGDSSRAARFYSKNEQWACYKAQSGTDPLLRHLSCLGSRLNEALAALGVQQLNEQSFAGASLSFMETLRPDSQVLITECGAYGDPGTSHIDWLSGLDKESTAALLASDEQVKTAMSKRNCWIGRSRVQIEPYSNMSQLTGLDNRSLLPPYIPVMRGEDQLFGHMLRYLHPHSVCLDQPWAVPHLPIPERTWTDKNNRFTTDYQFQAFSMSVVRDNISKCTAKGPLARIEQLGRLYEGLGQANHDELVERYLDQSTARRADDYMHLKSVAESSDDAPDAWRTFVGEGIKRLNRQLVDTPVDATLSGYPPGLVNEDLSAWWIGFWNEFSHALKSWPAIRLAARQITEGKTQA